MEIYSPTLFIEINNDEFIFMVGDENNKEDFIKRKRIKNIVPNYERCIAKRANGEQCTRRNKNGEQFCGTHIKGTPHGIIDINNTSKSFLYSFLKSL